MLNSPTGQLVGGKSERCVRYADTNKPTTAEASIAHRRVSLFIAVRPFRHSTSERLFREGACSGIYIVSLSEAFVERVNSDQPSGALSRAPVGFSCLLPYFLQADGNPLAYEATITSKRRLTLPKDLRKKFRLKEGDKVVLIPLEDAIILKHASIESASCAEFSVEK